MKWRINNHNLEVSAFGFSTKISCSITQIKILKYESQHEIDTLNLYLLRHSADKSASNSSL